MAGTIYFNGGSSTGSGNSPFHKLKSIPLLNRTAGESGDYSSATGTAFNVVNNFLPVWRTAAANNRFVFNNDNTGVVLATVGSGTVATITFASHLADSYVCSAYLSSSDQCLYLLLRNSTQFTLIKINDTSGAVTALASVFSPTTLANWPTAAYCLITDDGSGNLTLFWRGFNHSISKSTGAIVSQNVSASLSPYSLTASTYLSSDGTIGLAPFFSETNVTTTGGDYIQFNQIVSVSSGYIDNLRLQYALISDKNLHYAFNAQRNMICVDNDKLFLGDPSGISSGSNTGKTTFGYIYRADFDKFLQSVVDWYTGG